MFTFKNRNSLKKIQQFGASTMAAVAVAMALSACGGGGGDAEGSGSAASSNPSSTPKTTLASCINVVDGYSMARSYTDTDNSTATETISYATGVYNGERVTLGTYKWSDDSTSGSAYMKYGSSYIQYKEVTPGRTTYTYSGFTLDLTKSVGESQTLAYTESDGSSTVAYSVNVKFDGMETLTFAGKTFNTCRVIFSGNQFEDSSRTGTQTATAWFAPGYGFMPVKLSAAITFTDGQSPSSGTITSIATVLSTTPSAATAAVSAAAYAEGSSATPASARHKLLF